jgi:hypothetical protein
MLHLGKIISANINSDTFVKAKDHLGRYHFGIVHYADFHLSNNYFRQIKFSYEKNRSSRQLLWCDRCCNLTSIDVNWRQLTTIDVNCRQLTVVFFQFLFLINVIMVSLCRETNCEIDDILFISSKCNLDLLQRLKCCFLYFFRSFSIKHYLMCAEFLFLPNLYSVHIGNSGLRVPFAKL